MMSSRSISRAKPEDEGAVVTIGQEPVEVPYGQSNAVLVTRDLVPSEPRMRELKFRHGSGRVLSIQTDGDGGPRSSSL